MYESSKRYHHLFDIYIKGRIVIRHGVASVNSLTMENLTKL